MLDMTLWFDWAVNLNTNNTVIYLYLQLPVIAYDQSISPKEGTATVTVDIIRNQFEPVFEHPTFVRVSISEYIQIGTVIYDVNATDPDSAVPESRNVSFYV